MKDLLESMLRSYSDCVSSRCWDDKIMANVAALLVILTSPVWLPLTLAGYGLMKLLGLAVRSLP